MSGRGKGGKGLGKGGAKRHRKVLRDNIQVCWLLNLASFLRFRSTNFVIPTRICSNRVSPSQPFVVWLVVEVLSVSLVSSTKRPEVSLRSSSRTSFVTLSPTLSTPVVRLSLPWMWCMLLSDKERPSTVSDIKCPNPEVVFANLFKRCLSTPPEE